MGRVYLSPVVSIYSMPIDILTLSFGDATELDWNNGTGDPCEP